MSVEARELGQDLLQRGPIDTSIGGRPMTVGLQREGQSGSFVGRVTVWDGASITSNVVTNPQIDLEHVVCDLGAEVLRAVVRR